MSKVKLDFGQINNSCITNLDNAIDTLNSAISFLQQNLIPDDFYRKNTLSNIIADLKSKRDNLVYVKNWLINSNTNYNSMIDKLNIQANKLPVCRVKSRITKV